MKRILIALLVAVLALAGSTNEARAFGERGQVSLPLCDLYSGIAVALENSPEEGAPTRAWAEYYADYYQTLADTGVQAWNAYHAGMYIADTIESCLTARVREDFRRALAHVFFEKTLQKLEDSRSSLVRRFAADIREMGLEGESLLFQLTDTGPKDSSPSSSMAGFHRGHGSLFFSLGRIDPSEWPVIFVHELVHARDRRLAKATREFRDPERTRVVELLAGSGRGREDLSSRETDELRIWVRAGLDRGLLAEYRAWTVTLVLYEEGRKFATFRPVLWLDLLLKDRQPGERTEAFAFRFLDSTFKSPSTGLFASPLIQGELERQRAELRLAAQPPPLYHILNFFEKPVSHLFVRVRPMSFVVPESTD